MLPHEKALVKRMQQQPFALIGVNNDGPATEVLPALPEGRHHLAQRDRGPEGLARLALERRQLPEPLPGRRPGRDPSALDRLAG
jgi:hypothetical protein